jgi:hypothetical protein
MTKSEGVPLIVSWGGGVNSTAVLIGLRQRSIRPDLILFADTGAEKPETYAYLKILQDWLETQEWPRIVVLRKNSIYKSLEDNCLSKGMLPSLAYGFKSCSDKWKRQPQDQYANHLEITRNCWSAGKKVVKALGFDAGEVRRAHIAEDRQYCYWYPLIDWGWYREDCINAIQAAHLPTPRKSSCFFCPASKKAEVIALSQEHPDLYQRAVDLERRARPNLHVVRGLGRHWSWEELVNLKSTDISALRETPDMPCLCVDESTDD